MPLPIQRTPLALGDVLSIFGGQTPRELSELAHGSIDLLQFYGRSQLQSQFVNNAAAATGAAVSATVPANQYWVLFHAFARAVIPAAATWLDVRLTCDPNQSIIAQNAASGVIAAGRVVTASLVFPYPLLLGPGQRIGASWAFDGGGNASLSVNAVVGVLG